VGSIKKIVINRQDLSFVTCAVTADTSSEEDKEERLVAVFFPMNNRFDRFLYASVFERHGLPVTVLSALARQNLDPWEEAARLAGLSRDEAIYSLTATIWRTSSEVSHTAASELARRLVELLPTAEHPHSVAHGAEDPVSLWLIYGIFLFMMAISSNVSPQPKNDQSHQARTTVVEQTAKAPSETMSPMQTRK
jgi:hypothetical protein